MDTSGNNYRKPWFVGQFLCISGMLLYTLAVDFGRTRFAVSVLLVSRILYGIGAASGHMVYTYITSVIEPEQLSFAILVLSIAQGTGLAFGPFANEILSSLNASLDFLGWTIPLNEYNGVGFLVASFHSFGLLSTRLQELVLAISLPLEIVLVG